jgi:hypothetical protein
MASGFVESQIYSLPTRLFQAVTVQFKQRLSQLGSMLNSSFKSNYINPQQNYIPDSMY